MKITKENLYNKGVFLSIQISAWGAKTKVDNELLKNKEIEDNGIFHIVQDLLLKEDLLILKELKDNKHKIYKTVRKNRIPFPIEGMFLIPMNKVEFVNSQIEQGQIERQELVNNLVERIGQAKSKFKKKYPTLFKEEKYPSKQMLENSFKISYSWKQLIPPDNDNPTLEKLFKKEWDKFKDEIEEMKSMTLSMVSETIIKKLTILKNQVKDDKVHGKTFNSIFNYLEQFDSVFENFIDNKKIKTVIKEVRDFMNSADLQTWKDNESFKKEVLVKINDVIDKTEVIIKKPKRMIIL